MDYIWRYHPPTQESDAIIGRAYLDYVQYLHARDRAEFKRCLPDERRLELARFTSLVGELYGRTYFTTKHGLVGLGAPGTQPGDCIVIVCGAKNPSCCVVCVLCGLSEKSTWKT